MGRYSELPVAQLSARDEEGRAGDLLPLQCEAARRRRYLQDREDGGTRPHAVRSREQVLRPREQTRGPALGLGHRRTGTGAAVRVTRRTPDAARTCAVPLAREREPPFGPSPHRRGVRRDRQLRDYEGLKMRGNFAGW